MILARIKRGATRSLLLVKHKLHSASLRATRTSWRPARNFIQTGLAVLTVLAPVQSVAPSSVLAAGETTEPPSIVRLSSSATEALAFTPTLPTALEVRSQTLQTVAVGKSIATTQAEEAANAAAEQARIAAEQEAQRQAQEAARIAAAQKAAQQAAARAAANRAALLAAIPTDGNAIMDAVGIPESDRIYVNYIINREASWQGVTRSNRLGSGAYGICQALPGSKMASAGADWRTNPVTQLRWCDSYAKGRYGSWAGAFSAWHRQGWW